MQSERWSPVRIIDSSHGSAASRTARPVCPRNHFCTPDSAVSGDSPARQDVWNRSDNSALDRSHIGHKVLTTHAAPAKGNRSAARSTH
jgi:hypothetical protein